MKQQQEDPQVRLVWLGGVMGALFVVLFLGLVTRQIIQYSHFKHLEERQSLRRVLLPAPRGIITDRNGVVLASNKPVFSLIVYLGELRGEFHKELIRLVKEAREQKRTVDRDILQRSAIGNVLKAALNPVEKYLDEPIALDADRIERHLNEKPLLPYTLLDHLTLVQFARLTELLKVDAPVQLQVRSQRVYPEGDSACHLLGFVSMREPEVDESDLKTFSTKDQVGVSGVEESFDNTLAGQMGHELWIVDPSGFKFEPTQRVKAVSGTPLQLSVDVRQQKAIEKAFGQKIGAAAAIDIRTGEVLALVSKPSYNLNDLVPHFGTQVQEKINIHSGWLNRAIRGLYPPGSTFKIVTALAAIDAGKLDLDETVNCRGFLEIGKRNYPCNKKSGHGPVNLVGALEKSCNVYFYTMGLRTGPDAIMAKAREFGLDKPTNIELPDETSRMLLPTPEWKKRTLLEPWYAGDTANVAIGQGDLLITPLQMSCLVASVARGDTKTPVTILKKPHPLELPRKAYPEGWARVIEGMKAAAASGTARLAHVNGLPIAGKTGTAQVKSNGESLTLAWFIGFAPADDPQVAISVMVESISPDDEYAGGTIAAPIARSFFEEWQKDRE
jgi:penicillin-binding protein 2